VRGSAVDGALNLLKSGLKGADVALQVDINLEEGFKHLLWGISATANSLLHLVKGVLGGVKKGLIH
jgi:hypothetical protein